MEKRRELIVDLIFPDIYFVRTDLTVAGASGGTRLWKQLINLGQIFASQINLDVVQHFTLPYKQLRLLGAKSAYRECALLKQTDEQDVGNAFAMPSRSQEIDHNFSDKVGTKIARHD